MKRRHLIFVSLALALSPLIAMPAMAQETPVKPEVNPPGDIPDSQVFTTFKSADGYSIKVPEGWARREESGQTIFSDKYNRIALTSQPSTQALDMAYATKTLAPEIEKTGRAVKINKILSVKLRAGEAIRIIYDSNSEPNSVTNKQVRQENERYYYARDGKLVSLDLSAPKGADNVDQWKLISASFRWK